MRFLPTITAIAATALASPISHPLLARDNPVQASDIIAKIMPTSTSCDAAQASRPEDCRTNKQADTPFIAAMIQYKLFDAGQIAAVLALTGFESVDLKYKHNISPGRAGQGTSAMLMPPNVAKYAASIAAVKDGLAAAGGDTAKILELVTPDEYSFGAAAWYLTSQCAGVAEGLKGASDAGWTAYMACVGVDGTDAGRVAYWTRAKAAFGL